MPMQNEYAKLLVVSGIPCTSLKGILTPYSYKWEVFLIGLKLKDAAKLSTQKRGNFRIWFCCSIFNSITMNCFPSFPLVLFIAKIRRQEGKYETRWLQFVDIHTPIGFRLIFRKMARAILHDCTSLLIKWSLLVCLFFFLFLTIRQIFFTWSQFKRSTKIGMEQGVHMENFQVFSTANKMTI